MALKKWMTRHPTLKSFLGFLPLLVLVLAFYWRVLVSFSGLIGWGNFITPISLDEVYSPYYLWNPFQFGGMPNATPVSVFVTLTISNTFWWFTGSVIGLTAALKLYIIVSVVFVTAAFYLLLSTVAQTALARVLGTGFFLLNPLSVQVLSIGDFNELIFEGFLFLSIYLLAISFSSRRRISPCFVASLVILSLTSGSYQVLFLGVVLYFGFALYFIVTKAGFFSNRPLRQLAVFALKSLLILPIFAPFLLSTLANYSSVAPGSPLAPSLAIFQAFSVPFVPLLLLSAYPPNLGFVVVSSAYPWLYALWDTVTIAVLLFCLLSYLIWRDGRLLYLAFGVILAALLGSGGQGPLPGLTEFLFLSFPGYQGLNASYFWGWLVIVPLYGVLLSLVVDHILGRDAIQTEIVRRFIASVERVTPQGHRVANRGPRAFLRPLIVSGVVLLVILPPLASQGYYSDSGIKDNQSILPGEYATIPRQLDSLIGSSGDGVAVFNPDANLFFANVSDYAFNPFVLFPTVRTAGLPYYASPPTTAARYFYWVYEQFYLNQTKYVGELLGLEGIEYLLVLYGTNAASYQGNFMPWSIGVNASALLPYQTGIEQIFSDRYYAIYRNLYAGPMLTLVHNFTLLEGDFDTLNELAYAGVNLTDLGLVLPSDLNPSNWNEILNHTKTIVTSDPSGIQDLALQSIQDAQVSIFSSLDRSLSTPTQGWVSSSTVEVSGPPFVQSQPSPFVVVDSPNKSLSLPIDVENKPGNTLWAQVLFSEQYGGQLTLRLDGKALTTLRTNESYGGSTNEFVWIQVPINTSGPSSLSFDSLSGWNAIGSAFLVSGTALESAVDEIRATMNRSGVRDIIMKPGDSLAGFTSGSGSWGHGSAGNSSVGGSSYVYLNAQGGSNEASLMFPVNGLGPSAVFVQIEATSSSILTLYYGSFNETFGVATGVYHPNGWYWIKAILPDSPTGFGPTALSLTDVQGLCFIAAIVVVSDNSLTSSLITAANLSQVKQVYAPRATNLSYTIRTGINQTSISGIFEYTNASFQSGTILNLYFKGAFSYTSTLFLQYSVSCGILASINGISFGGDSVGSGLAIPPGLFSIFAGLRPQNYSLTFTLDPRSLAQDGKALFNVSIGVSPDPSPLNPIRISDVSAVTSELAVSDSGYSFDAPTAGTYLLRYAYFGSQFSASYATISSAFSQLNTFITVNGPQYPVRVQTTSLNYITAGLAIEAATLGIVAIAVVFSSKIRRKRGRRSDDRRSRSRANG